MLTRRFWTKSAWCGSLLVLPLALGVACGGEDEEPATGTTVGNAAEFVCTSVDAEPGSPKVYFAPFDPVEEQVLCALDRAKEEVLVAHYNIRRQSYLDKLVELSQRGVKVKVAVDAGNADKDYNVGDDFLEQNGIEIVRKKISSRALMHLKVTVIDQEMVMTGSFNWNGTASLANDENMIALRNPALAERYRNELLEVYGEKPRETEGGFVSDGVDLHFSPEEDLDTVIAGHLATATSSVDVAMFTFTRHQIKDALINAVQNGVTVRVVMEKKQTGFTSVDEELEAAGAQVLKAANTIGSFSAMHHKYAVIDGHKVLTGATNWTTTGTRQSEEDLLILDNAALAQQYLRNFTDLHYVYASQDSDDFAVPRTGVLFHTIHGDTQWGDRIVVTGNHAELGHWDPWKGANLETSESMFPNWTANVTVGAGDDIEYKFVLLKANGDVVWEPGGNRHLHIPESGRGSVISGPYGDTSSNWTPANAPQ